MTTAVDLAPGGVYDVVDLGAVEPAGAVSLGQSGGVMGPQGPPGPPGEPAPSYVHAQAVPVATWTITHGFGRRPHSIALYVGGELADTDTYADEQVLVLMFPSPSTGEVHYT